MRLIDADRAREKSTIDLITHFLDRQPTIDPESLRPKGRWIVLDECANSGVYCSVCNKKVYKEEYANQKLMSNYCPNCGAKMEG